MQSFYFLKKKIKRIFTSIWARETVFKRTKFLKMKNLFYIIILIFITSCKNKEDKNQSEKPKIASVENGKLLFEENNCVACHQLNQKIVGPSLQDIAKIYKAQNGNLVSFLKEGADPIVDPSMYETMKINLQVTKNMTDNELKSVQLFISSNSK